MFNTNLFLRISALSASFFYFYGVLEERSFLGHAEITEIKVIFVSTNHSRYFLRISALSACLLNLWF